MYRSDLRKALLAAADIIKNAETADENMMFDALVNLEIVARTAVEDHLIATSIQPRWRASAPTSFAYH